MIHRLRVVGVAAAATRRLQGRWSATARTWTAGTSRRVDGPGCGRTGTTRSATTELDPHRSVEVGDKLMARSGRIWTIAAFTPRGNRILLSRPTPEGPAAAIVGAGALAAMVPLPSHEPIRRDPAVVDRPGHRRVLIAAAAGHRSR